MTNPNGPLTGFRALDLIDGLGAYGPKVLTGLGAEVIRVEPPGGSAQRSASPLHEASGASLYFLHYNAGKKGISLDLETGEGRAILRRLLDQVDVVFDNGLLKQLGFDLVALAAKTPPLVVVSVTPFGLDSPRSDWLGDDLICQAMSGMISYYGYRNERPARFGPQQASEMSGLAAALGALIALFDARRSGKGEVIDIAAERVGALVTLQMSNASLYHQFGFERRRHERGAEPTGLYMARDGYVQMGAFRSLEPLLEVLDRFGAAEDLRDLKLSEAEFARHPQVQEVLRKFIGARNRMEVVEAVQAQGVICVPINDVKDLVSDPFLQGRHFFTEVELPGGAMVQDAGVPMRFDKTPFAIDAHPPALGEHNAEIYGRLGLEGAELARLRREGVI